MKRITFIIIFIFFAVVMLAACGADNEEDISATASTVPTVEPTPEPKAKIGISLSADNSFSTALLEEITAIAEAQDIMVLSDNAKADCAAQVKGVKKLLEDGAEYMIIDPVDLDESEAASEECNLSDVPVINIMEPINGLVTMLISPSYNRIGEAAAERAADLITKDEKVDGNVVMLKGTFNSFKMQLMTDGFFSVAENYEDFHIIADEFCDFDREKAKQAVLDIVRIHSVDVIFAEDSNMALGALDALEETVKEAKIICVGGDMEIVEKIKEEKIHTAIFFGAQELAQIVMENINKLIIDPEAELLQYAPLKLESIELETVDDYYDENAVYAKVLTKLSEETD